jgi:hypothetical protein
MKFKSILAVGLSTATLGLSSPAHAGYGAIYYIEGIKVVDLFTDRPSDRTTTSPTNSQNTGAVTSPTSEPTTDASLERKMKDAENLKNYGDSMSEMIRNMYP